MKILCGDALECLRGMESESVDCIVTSPPYWGLRDYGVDGQIGLEPDFGEFMERLLAVFLECQRVLKKSGTLWVNMGDAYACNGGEYGSAKSTLTGTKQDQVQVGSQKRFKKRGFRAKSLMGQPWRLAIGLMDQGWILRNDLIWHKVNGMPESAADRCARNHEYLFFFVKSKKYWSDFAQLKTESVRTEVVKKPHGGANSEKYAGRNAKYKERETCEVAAKAVGLEERKGGYETAHPRSVWPMAVANYKEAHFATFPNELPRRCILAGCPPGGIVLDVFAGSGTTLEEALKLGRDGIGIELNPKSVELIRKRLGLFDPMLEVAG